MANGLGLAEGPQVLTRARVDRDHLSPGRSDRIERAVDIDRRRAREVVEVGAEVVAAPDPRLL
jgi:hypothetical protein